ncbi:cytochrome b/b6 domain-containing protein [Halomonas cibimaris]|uniref:Cytochrome b/b6 domain-containing protein n=1 Tax=Halomonas cibimaris TaxID=657012 RepID=A0ABP7LD09_9GAMM
MTTNRQASPQGQRDRVRVWDPAVRLFHWGLVAAFAVAYVTVDSSRSVHQWAGYTALGLIAFRLIWGVIGTRHARFSDFVPGPRRLLDYMRRAVKGREPRYLGHNPAAAIMILFLLAATGAIGISGWLLTTDWGWGSRTIEQIHETSVNVTLVAIGLHVAAAIYESLHHRENLIRSMITGHKRR